VLPDRPGSQAFGGASPAAKPASKALHGIVLAGAYAWSGSSIDELTPRALLPVVKTPLIGYALRWLSDGGIRRVTVCANSAARRVRERLRDGSSLGMLLDCQEDWMPRGPAGCAYDTSLRSDAESFVVVDGTGIPAVDISELLATHQDTGAALTVVADRVGDASSGGETALQPAGIYVIERRALDLVSSQGFQDLKEGLIPKLYEAGENVAIQQSAGFSLRVLDAESYLAVNSWVVERLVEDGEPLETYHLTGETLAHESTRVHPAATLVGPIVLGPNVTVESGAVLVGPLVVGAGGTVGERALVARSVTWSRCVMGAGAVVDTCILTDETTVERGDKVFGAIMTPAHRGGVLGRLRDWREARRPRRTGLALDWGPGFSLMPRLARGFGPSTKPKSLFSVVAVVGPGREVSTPTPGLWVLPGQ